MSKNTEAVIVSLTFTAMWLLSFVFAVIVQELELGIRFTYWIGVVVGVVVGVVMVFIGLNRFKMFDKIKRR